jgi:hypothetical protein
MIKKYIKQRSRFDCLSVCVEMLTGVSHLDIPIFFEYNESCWTTLGLWCKLRGFIMHTHQKSIEHPHIAIVQSFDRESVGTSHAVIWADNNLVFDPGSKGQNYNWEYTTGIDIMTLSEYYSRALSNR